MRLRLYRKISNIININELKDMLSNLNDRFGNIPILSKFISYNWNQNKSQKDEYKKIENTNKGFVLEFKDDNMINVENTYKVSWKKF